jgi:hypothetical protein
MPVALLQYANKLPSSIVLRNVSCTPHCYTDYCSVTSDPDTDVSLDIQRSQMVRISAAKLTNSSRGGHQLVLAQLRRQGSGAHRGLKDLWKLARRVRLCAQARR